MEKLKHCTLFFAALIQFYFFIVDVKMFESIFLNSFFKLILCTALYLYLYLY